jgi:prepilin peptidase dependent protein B
MWHAGTATVIGNPYVAVTPSAATSDTVSFRFSRDSTENNAIDTNEQFGFRLHKGVVEMQLGSGWQAMTDAGTMTVLSFDVTPVVQEIALQGLCEKPCPSGGTECMPRQQVRSLAVAITGRSTADSAVVRSVRSNVRLRNDAVVGLCPA